VTAIAYAGSSSLLIYIETTSGDLSQNGLWKINTDGSDLTRLTATKVLTCQYTQYAYPLTQVSSDGARYALLYMDEGEQKLIVGSLAGGSSTTISAHQFSNVNILLLVGMGIF
jgi:Tol biopolymer transport system component